MRPHMRTKTTKLMDGATGGTAAILGGRHHRLELLEVDAAISVGVWNP